MVKVFRFNSPLSIFILLAFLALFVFVGLPLFLVAAATFLVISTVRSLFLGSNPKEKIQRYDENAHVSPIIHNDKIGSYRVIENPHDPNVIEVEKV